MDVDHKFKPYFWKENMTKPPQKHVACDVAGMVTPQKKEGRPAAIQI